MPNPVLWLAEHPAWLPVVIFFARICDVSLGTIRTICIVRGLRLVAALLGFFEVLIWVVAISSVVNHLHNPLNMIAYAGGFATGNWVGVWLEGRLALGQQIVRLISYDPEGRLAESLRSAGFVVTELDGHGRDAPVKICFIATNRREVPAVLARATRVDPQVFATIEDVRAANRALTRYAPERVGWASVLKRK